MNNELKLPPPPTAIFFVMFPIPLVTKNLDFFKYLSKAKQDICLTTETCCHCCVHTKVCFHLHLSALYKYLGNVCTAQAQADARMLTTTISPRV